jgi:hypothetical protein
MRALRRLPASAGAAVLLAAATAALVGAPYDGGSCRNVFSAYATPVAQVTPVQRPAEPAGLGDAREALEAVRAEDAELAPDRAKVARAVSAAERAEREADAAEQARRNTPTESSTPSWELDSAELDVDIAEGSVDSAEDWLDIVQGDDFGFYDAYDIAEAQEDVDEARADLAEAQAVLDEQLAAKAKAAEKTADRLSDILAAEERTLNSRLRPAESLVDDLEEEHAAALGEWTHEQRVAEDEVVARNAVRDACRENGLWRAGIAGADLLLLGALGVRAAWPRLRLPGRRG